MASGDDHKLTPTTPVVGAFFGTRVAAADVDGDGAAELIVGDDLDGVWCYPGGAGGPVAGAESSLGAVVGGAGDGFGVALAAGDPDGDGEIDLVVGAPYATGTGLAEGAAYVYEHSGAGFDASSERLLAPSDPMASDGFGYAVAMGDTDGDGVSDVLVGSAYHSHSASVEGAAYVFFGDSSGPAATADDELLPRAATAWGAFGSALTVGDLDGDGFDDVVVGAPSWAAGAGAAYVYYGSLSGPDGAGEVKLQASDATGADAFGVAVFAGSDLDGDGYLDLAVGAPDAEVDGIATGAVYLYVGGGSGVSATSELKVASGSAAPGEQFGAELDGGEDLDLDGHDELAVGAYQASSGAGVVSLWYGAAATLVGDETRLGASDATSNAYLGYSLAFADLDGDGNSDLVSGAVGESTAAASAGAVYWWAGDPDVDGDGSPASEDCDDTDATVSPIAAEACNGIDDDCDGDVDESGPLHAPDLDGDGYGDAASAVDTCTPPADFVADATDCDDGAAEVHPGAAETDCADPVDYDCDGTSGRDDPDADGIASCLDCAPHDAAIHPGAPEVCDAAGVDDDCDGLADDADPGVTGTTVFYADADGDGAGDAATTRAACVEPTGFVASAGDCDDAAAAVHPGAAEVCDAADQDEDCDGLADDADPDVDATTASTAYFRDADGDGFAGTAAVACDLPADGSLTATDCDDHNALRNPDKPEVCDAPDVDDDCDGLADDDDPDVWDGSFDAFHPDADADGYGDAATTVLRCDLTPDTVADGSDCDDTNAAVHPGVLERCDGGVDNDCDGAADDDDLVTDRETESEFFLDLDEDGYFGTSLWACEPPAASAAVADDCNDEDPATYPGAAETCGGTGDEDCDGLTDDEDPDVADPAWWYPDDDADGYGAAEEVRACVAPVGTVANDDDCDDGDPERHPGAVETCDGADNDCDAAVDEEAVDATQPAWRDADADGHGDPDAEGAACVDGSDGWVANHSDCADDDPTLFGAYSTADGEVVPGATEVCDGEDQDCDGEVDENDLGCGCDRCLGASDADTCAGAGLFLGGAILLRRRRAGRGRVA